jgi:5-methylcytosine-specific restriction endonuclease McrA
MNRTEINKKANIEIDKQALALEITYCEICGSTFGLTRMHRHKRLWYKDKPDHLLWRIDQWMIACLHPCHEFYEKDAEATEEIFMRIRGEEYETKDIRLL